MASPEVGALLQRYGRWHHSELIGDQPVLRAALASGRVTSLIANTDASGEVGRGVAERLAERGIRQLLIVTEGADAPELPDAEVVTITGYGDVESVRAAAAGVETLFLIPLREHPERVQQHRAAVDAAVAAGVERIVYSSFLGAAPDATFVLARDHYATEEHIKSTGIAYTFLRGSAYLEVLRWIIGSDGVIRGPAGAGRVAPVARDDMADVAATILASHGAHDGETYDVTGPRTLSLHDVAEEFALVTGRSVTFVDETVEERGRPGEAPVPLSGRWRHG
jgi:NAD(P)H dehydrogenase (quinone)